MSKLSIIGIVIVLVIVSFIWGHRGGVSISGNGNVTTETKAISDFTQLKLDGVFKTIISQDGGPVWIKVEADQNLQPAVEVKNDGETLIVKNKSGFNFNDPGKMVVYVNVKNLNSLTNTSIGKVETSGTIQVQNLYLKNDAVGKTTLSLKVQKLNAKLDAVGSTILTGSATEADISNKSVGKLDAYDLKTDILNITNKGVGPVEVYAEKEIFIDHDGVGSLHYKGPAMVKNLKDNGVGKVSKAD